MALPDRPLSILVCDDDEVTLKTLTRVVSRLCPDCSVYSASNGRTGLESFEKYSPDIVITDIKMPFLNGIEMARQMKLVKAELKTIVVTASGERNLVRTKAKGPVEIDYFCSKPLAYQNLVEAISGCVARISAERGS